MFLIYLLVYPNYNRTGSLYSPEKENNFKLQYLNSYVREDTSLKIRYPYMNLCMLYYCAMVLLQYKLLIAVHLL